MSGTERSDEHATAPLLLNERVTLTFKKTDIIPEYPLSFAVKVDGDKKDGMFVDLDFKENVLEKYRDLSSLCALSLIHI